MEKCSRNSEISSFFIKVGDVWRNYQKIDADATAAYEKKNYRNNASDELLPSPNWKLSKTVNKNEKNQ